MVTPVYYEMGTVTSSSSTGRKEVASRRLLLSNRIRESIKD
jgi:hypothetical protein